MWDVDRAYWEIRAQQERQRWWRRRMAFGIERLMVDRCWAYYIKRGEGGADITVCLMGTFPSSPQRFLYHRAKKHKQAEHITDACTTFSHTHTSAVSMKLSEFHPGTWNCALQAAKGLNSTSTHGEPEIVQLKGKCVLFHCRPTIHTAVQPETLSFIRFIQHFHSLFSLTNDYFNNDTLRSKMIKKGRPETLQWWCWGSLGHFCDIGLGFLLVPFNKTTNPLFSYLICRVGRLKLNTEAMKVKEVLW